MAQKTVEQMIAELQAQQEAARAANEKRYGDILSLYEGQGKSTKADIEQAGAEEKAQQQQSLVSRGLGGTGVLEAYAGQTNQRTAREKGRVDEAVAMNKAGVMERRTDAYPDMNLYASLLQSLGNAQGQNAQHHQTLSGYSGGGGGSRGASSRSREAGYGAYSAAGGGGGGGGYSGVATFTGGAGGGYGSLGGYGYEGGATLTGEAAERFGGAGAQRVSIPPVLGGRGSSYLSMYGRDSGEQMYQDPGDVGPMAPEDYSQTSGGGEDQGDTGEVPGYEGAAATAGGEGQSAQGAGEQMVLAVTNPNSNRERQYRRVPQSQAKWSANGQYWYVA